MGIVTFFVLNVLQPLLREQELYLMHPSHYS